MSRNSAFALVAILCVGFGTCEHASALAQQTSIERPGATAARGATAAKEIGSASISSQQDVYYAGPDVTVPKLLPLTVEVSMPKNCIERDGMLKFSAVVSRDGVLHDVKQIESDDARLNGFALQLIEAQRFTPGQYRGVTEASHRQLQSN